MASAPLSGRHALVTGGGRGIGRAVAAALTREGAAVTVTGRDEGRLAEAVSSGDATRAETADATDADAVRAAIARAADALGPVDLLVANAGQAVSKPFGRTAPAEFAAMWSLNLMGVVHAFQAALPGMEGRGFGRLVAIASTAALKGYPYVSAYCASKHAVLGLVRALAVETARSGVTVNAVCPGFTETDLVADSIERIVRKTGRSREDARAELVRGNPQGRLVAPAEVADAVLWLCGPGSGAVTGQAIAVAGGEV